MQLRRTRNQHDRIIFNGTDLSKLVYCKVRRPIMATEHATVNNQTAPVTIDSDYFEINGRCHLNITSGTAVLEWVERWL